VIVFTCSAHVSSRATHTVCSDLVTGTTNPVTRAITGVSGQDRHRGESSCYPLERRDLVSSLTCERIILML